MKNTKDLRADDGSRWAILHGPATALFQSWGATEIYTVPREQLGDRGPTFMIKLEDGWHYAHESSLESAYAAADVYDAPNGNAAWWMFELGLAISNETRARGSLQNAIAWNAEVQDKLAMAMKGES